MKKYYEIVNSVALKVLKKFQFFRVCYVIDDEFHFLFHTNDVDKKLCRISKIVVLPTSYTTALVNNEISRDDIISRKQINFKKLCYDGRLIKLKKSKTAPYFIDLINHGKMFLGHIIVGDRKYFVQMSMKEILSKAVSLKVNITNEYGIVFGRLIVRDSSEIKMINLDINLHKNKVIDNIRRYKQIKKEN